MTRKSWLTFVFICIISTTSFGKEFEFVVSPENCGKMTLEDCEEFMVWAKADMEALQKSIDDDKAEIKRMHEEALGVLSNSTK